MKKYIKPPLDIDSQLKLLKQRNLCINDEERVKRYLSFISYYRLSAYFEPYQLLGKEDFIKGVTFDTVLDTYLFDRKLRLLVLDAIERIETAIKAQLANKYSVVYGANWLENIELFKNTRKFHKQLIWIDDILKNTGNTEQFISIFKKKHQGRPPAWMIFEVISLGALSKIYENLKTTDVKKNISKAFLMPPVVFESFLKMLTVVRNYSAHHSRLWNRKVTTNRMRFPRDMGGLWLQNRHVNTEKLYFILSILLYLLNTIIPKNHFKQKFKELQASYPKVSLEMMGFPDNWKNEVLWR